MATQRLERKNTIGDADYLRVSTELMTNDREIARLTEELAGARGVKAGILKRFVGMGGNKAALLALRKKAKIDEDERLKDMEDEARYAALEGIKLWTAPTADQPQGAMFDAETTEAKAKHRAAHIYTDGYNTRKAGGGPDDNPHIQGTEDHQTWRLAFEDCERDLATRGSQGAAVAPAKKRDPRKTEPAEPKRQPGRPKKGAPIEGSADEIGETVGTA